MMTILVSAQSYCADDGVDKSAFLMACRPQKLMVDRSASPAMAIGFMETIW
jgi:hypothetical protein